MKSEIVVHCAVVSNQSSYCNHFTTSMQSCVSKLFKQDIPNGSLETRRLCPAGGISARCMQSIDSLDIGEPKNLLCMPNKGKIPPKLDRMKLFAASALAAKVGYASTRNVKTPEKTRIVLEVTREDVSTLLVWESEILTGEQLGTYPAPKRALPIIGAIQCTSG